MYFSRIFTKILQIFFIKLLNSRQLQGVEWIVHQLDIFWVIILSFMINIINKSFYLIIKFHDFSSLFWSWFFYLLPSPRNGTFLLDHKLSNIGVICIACSNSLSYIHHDYPILSRPVKWYFPFRSYMDSEQFKLFDIVICIVFFNSLSFFVFHHDFSTLSRPL